MNNTVLAGLIVGSVVVAAAAAIAVNSGFDPLQKYATVVAVEPAFETNRVPREVCGEAAKLALAHSVAQAPDAQQPQSATGEEKAKPAEPAAKPDGDKAKDEESDCVMVYDSESIQAGYNVTYELDGVQNMVRMDHDPGERIPVKNGELVLSQS